MNRSRFAGALTIAAVAGFLLALGGQFLLELGWGSDSAQQGGGEGAVLARVGDWQLTVQEFEAEVDRLAQFDRPDTAKSRRALLEDRVSRAVMAENARRAGYYENFEVKAQLDRIATSQFIDDQMRGRLEGVAASDAEVVAEYESNLGRYTTPERVRIAAILIPVPEGATDQRRTAQREKAEAAAAEARRQSLDPNAPRSFGPLAVRYSEDRVSRYIGGDLGWIDRGSEGDWRPQLFEASLALERTGDISGLIEAEHGYAIVKLIERRDEVVQPLEDLEGRIRQRLLAAKREAIHQGFLEEMRAAVRVELDEQAYASLPSPSAATGERERPRAPRVPGG